MKIHKIIKDLRFTKESIEDQDDAEKPKNTQPFLCVIMKSSTFPNRFGLWYNSLVKNCNHKGLGIYYLLTAFIFGISGTLISVLIRIELYSSGNRIISPENQNFYNISITLTGKWSKNLLSSSSCTLSLYHLVS